MIPSEVLALDISSVTGVAFFQGSTLVHYAQDELKNPHKGKNFPLNAYPWARLVANDLFHNKVMPAFSLNPLVEVVIERTNQARNRNSQAFLEGVHAYLYEMLTAHNVKFSYLDSSDWRREVGLQMSKDDKKHNKLLRQNKGRGKITKKHLALRLVKELFGLDLLVKENNIADACLLGWAFILKGKS